MDTVVDSGSIMVLNCQAQGEPTPVIEWVRQGRPLLANDRITTLTNGSLRISSAQKEDTAEYECVARNLLGSTLAHVALTVRGKIADCVLIIVINNLLILSYNSVSNNSTCICVLHTAVHGGFSEWMEWGACSVSCGTGVQKRLRRCNNPQPANGGRHCSGSDSETRSCQGKPCPGQLT